MNTNTNTNTKRDNSHKHHMSQDSRTCPQCQEEYVSKNKRHTLCYKCHQAQLRACTMCGDKFIPHDHKKGTYRSYETEETRLQKCISCWGQRSKISTPNGFAKGETVRGKKTIKCSLCNEDMTIYEGESTYSAKCNACNKLRAKISNLESKNGDVDMSTLDSAVFSHKFVMRVTYEAVTQEEDTQEEDTEKCTFYYPLLKKFTNSLIDFEGRVLYTCGGLMGYYDKQHCYNHDGTRGGYSIHKAQVVEPQVRKIDLGQ